MKKNIFLSAVLILFSCSLFAQDTVKYESSNSKIEILFIPKFGFAKISQSESPKINGFVNGGDILLAFKLKNGSFLSSGIGYNDFNANSTVAGENANLNNIYLRIPVNYISNFSFFKNKNNADFVFLSLGIGFYANTLLKSEVESFIGTNSEKNLGWNFGLSSYVGAKFSVSDTFNLGIGLETNNDLTKMKKDDFEQKINNLTTLNLTLGFRLK